MNQEGKGESHNKTCRRQSSYYDVTSDDIKKRTGHIHPRGYCNYQKECAEMARRVVRVSQIRGKPRDPNIKTKLSEELSSTLPSKLSLFTDMLALSYCVS